MPPRPTRAGWFAIAVGAAVVVLFVAGGAALLTVVAVNSLSSTSAPRSSSHDLPTDRSPPSNIGADTHDNQAPTSTSPTPQSADQLDAMATEALAGLQVQSIEEQVEFCSYIVTDGTTLSTAPVRRGDKAGCSLVEPKTGEVVASFHTHGNHDPGYWSEVPSADDVDGDMDDGIPGYIGTPGGRVWVTDPNDGSVEVLCGLGCIPSDPAYRAEDVEPFNDEMTYEELASYLDG